MIPPKTLPVRGLEEHVQVSLIFAIIVSFMLFTVFSLVYVLYIEKFLLSKEDVNPPTQKTHWD